MDNLSVFPETVTTVCLPTFFRNLEPAASVMQERSHSAVALSLFYVITHSAAHHHGSQAQTQIKNIHTRLCNLWLWYWSIL